MYADQEAEVLARIYKYLIDRFDEEKPAADSEPSREQLSAASDTDPQRTDVRAEDTQQ